MLSKQIGWPPRWAGSDASKTVGGTSGHDFLFGTDDNDALLGREGDDELFGRKGNDTLDGGQGADKLYGEAGNDTLDGGQGADKLYGEAGQDTLTGGSGDVLIDGGADSDHGVLDFGSQDENLYFSVISNLDGGRVVAGTTIRNIERVTFTAGSGDDEIRGGGGNDVLKGGAGHDELWNGQYTNASNGVDVLDGGAGVDTATLLFYTATGDLTFAVNPSATVTLNNGTQLKSIEAVNFKAGSGNDTLTGGARDDSLAGNSGNDTLAGLGGKDALYGATGNDTLTGGWAEDFLAGGSGADKLTGGSGNDVFVFRKGETGGDQVFDFAGHGADAGDTLRFEGFGSSAYLTHQGAEWTIHDGDHTETFTLNVSSLAVDDYAFA